MDTIQDTEKCDGPLSPTPPSPVAQATTGQPDVSSAGQSGEKLIAPDSDLKCAIKQQITDALCSSEVIDIITEAVCDAIEKRLEEKITTKVYNAIDMDLEKKCSEIRSLEKEVKNLKASINALENAKDDAEQYSRRNCLTIHGVSESPNEETDKKVLDIINNNLGLSMGTEAIDRSHRIYRRPSHQGNPASLDSEQSATSYAVAAHRSNP